MRSVRLGVELQFFFQTSTSCQYLPSPCPARPCRVLCVVCRVHCCCCCWRAFVFAVLIYFTILGKRLIKLNQSVRSDMDAGRAAAGLPVADWSESHMVNVRLVVDVLIALGLVKSDYSTVEQSGGWPMDVHPPSERHGG